MPPLPNHAGAVIDDDKLVGYALNPQSERGQHKAREFENALGFNLSHWELMKPLRSKLRGIRMSRTLNVRVASFGESHPARDCNEPLLTRCRIMRQR
jgi:hypothetical protein